MHNVHLFPRNVSHLIQQNSFDTQNAKLSLNNIHRILVLCESLISIYIRPYATKQQYNHDTHILHLAVRIHVNGVTR